MKIDKMVENAQMASIVWSQISSENQAKIAKYFHLRPTNSGVTVVSTLSFLPMRGITVQSKKDLHIVLARIARDYKKIVGTNIKLAKSILIDDLGYKERSDISKFREEDAQAIMIRTMEGHRDLLHSLNVDVRFVASELILARKLGRIDIVGIAGETLYFFELKKDRTTDDKQLTGYKNSYTPEDAELRELLANYPIHPVESFKKIECVMVMQFAENSNLAQWKKNEDNDFQILFYKKSLAFITP
jgi:hypothetical protein